MTAVLTLELTLEAGPVRCGEPVPLRVAIVNSSAATVSMVGVVDGAEGAMRYPHYLPTIRRGDDVVAAPGDADPLVGPLRLVDIIRLAPGASFDPTRSSGGAAYLPLATFSTFRPQRPGPYRFELVVDTRSPEPAGWLGRFNQDADRDAVLAAVERIPRVRLSDVLEVVVDE